MSHHPTARTPSLLTLASRIDHVDHELKERPGRTTDAWAGRELDEIAELIYRASHHIKHGERG